MNNPLRSLPVALSWSATGVAAPASAQAAPTGVDWFGLLAPVVTVTVAMIAMLWWLHRGKSLRGRGAGPLRVVQAVAVGSRERVVIVDAQERRLLLGVTAHRVELLAELRATDTPDSTPPA